MYVGSRSLLLTKLKYADRDASVELLPAAIVYVYYFATSVVFLLDRGLLYRYIPWPLLIRQGLMMKERLECV